MLWTAGAAAPRVNPGGVLILSLVGVGVVLFRLRGALTRRVEQVFALSGCAVGVVWLVACSALGDTRLDWVGVLVWAGYAIPWWRHQRTRSTREEEAAAEVSGTEIVQWWADTAAAMGGAWPESRLSGVRAIEDGVTTEVVLPPAKLTTTDAVRAAERIASGRGSSVSQTLIEPTTSRAANRFQLTLLDRSQADAVHHWPGPQLDPATGLAAAGPYADRGLALARFWQPGSGPVHWMVSGSTGSGKSYFLNWMLLESKHSGLIASWVADPKGGQSLPAWRHAAHRFEDTPEGILGMLRDAKAELDARASRLSRLEWADADGRVWTGKDHFDPTPEDPILEITIDEAQDILEPGSEALRLVEHIARKGRSVGVRLVLATQMPSVDQLGGSMTLRGQVVAGCVAALRTAENVTKHMVLPPSFPVNPFDIPRETPTGEGTGGTMYLYGPQARPVLLRNWVVPNVHAAAADAPTIPLQLRSPTAAAPPVPDAEPDRLRSVPEAGSTDPALRNCAEAILALDWGGVRERTRRDIVDALHDRGLTYSLSAVQKALNDDGLTRPGGELEKARHGTYRRAATRGAAA